MTTETTTPSLILAAVHGVPVIDLEAMGSGVFRLTVAAGHERAAVALALQAGWDACTATPQRVTIVTEAPTHIGWDPAR